MLALLSPRLWIALALAGLLAFTHYKAFNGGKAAVQVRWDKERSEITAEALKASEAARAKENVLTAANQKVSADYAKQKKVNAVLAADLDDSLRQLQTAINSPVSANTPTPAGAYGRGGLERELLGGCSTSLAEMAITADRLETKVVGLQGYVRDVCMTKPSD